MIGVFTGAAAVDPEALLPAWVYELTPGAVGIWTLVAVVATALIRAWPVLALQIQTAREKLRAEGRSDLSECRERIDRLQEALDDVKEEVHKLEMKLLGAIGAYRILDTEVEKHVPDSSALIQARKLMSTAFTLSPSTDAPFVVPEGLR